MLEVGVGTGLNLDHYSRDVEVCGVDLSPGMLEIARRRAASLGRPADLRLMDAQHLEFTEARFDTVVFSLCLCTVPAPAEALAEGIRVLRPGGAMVLFEHVRSSIAPIAWLQAVATPLTWRLFADRFDQPTIDLARQTGLRIDSEERGRLGVFALAVGRV